MLETYKIINTANNAIIFAGYGEDIHMFFERLWIDCMENEKSICIHGRLGNVYYKHFPKTYENSGILIIKNSEKIYFDYMNQKELTEYMIKNCTDLVNERIDIFDVLGIDEDGDWKIMNIPDTEDDEQPWVFDLVDCPLSTIGNVRFRECRMCKHKSDCKSYLNIKQLPQCD